MAIGTLKTLHLLTLWCLGAGSLVFASNGPATAADGAVSFSGTIARVENGIGIGGDRTITRTFVDEAAIRVSVSNPSSRTARVRLSAFDEAFYRIDDVSLPAGIRLRPGETRHFIAYVPVTGKRRLRICATGTLGRNCGRFIAQRLR